MFLPTNGRFRSAEGHFLVASAVSKFLQKGDWLRVLKHHTFYVFEQVVAEGLWIVAPLSKLGYLFLGHWRIVVHSTGWAVTPPVFRPLASARARVVASAVAHISSQ